MQASMLVLFNPSAACLVRLSYQEVEERLNLSEGACCTAHCPYAMSHRTPAAVWPDSMHSQYQVSC